MKIKKFLLSMIIAISLATPFIYSFTFFNGFAGQIKPTDYPRDWYETNNFLNEDEQDFKILFLPWHGYMDFKWVNNTQKRIANPARNFFDKEIISATNVEIGQIYRQDNSPDQLYIDGLLINSGNITNFGELISILNVKYILLTKEIDYKKYFFLFNQTDLKLIKETENLYIFKNNVETKKIYQTDDLFNISKKIDIDYKKLSPVNFKLGESTRKYIIFTEPYSEYWQLDGQKPIKVFGVVNAFENKGNEIRFERFYKINLPSYIISIVTFIILIVLYKR